MSTILNIIRRAVRVPTVKDAPVNDADTKSILLENPVSKSCTPSDNTLNSSINCRVATEPVCVAQVNPLLNSSSDAVAEMNGNAEVR